MPSEIPDKLPKQCEITFAQILSRHAARDPTASKTLAYNATIAKLQATTKSYSDRYAFLEDYTYSLGADQLTKFGEQQMINSGVKFYRRYKHLASKNTPFLRTSGQQRVIDSAHYWAQGFHTAKLHDRASKHQDLDYPYPKVVISEYPGSNNTLDHGLCSKFESGAFAHIDDDAQAEWVATFTPPILERLKHNLPGAELIQSDVIDLMQMCPFDTVANADGSISPFCDIFREADFHQLDYYESLDKYYGFSNGNPLGPTQGVGFASELLARFTRAPVMDETCTNSTLDSDPKTFPLDRRLYADFSHDNDMTGIFSALGLYNSTPPLSNTSMRNIQQTRGFSASWVVPFASRAYFEKMQCRGEEEELVRIVVNDRVIPLHNCGADKMGRCKLSSFVESQGFVRKGGHWDQCYQ